MLVALGSRATSPRPCQASATGSRKSRCTCPLIVWPGPVHIDADTLLRGRDSRRDAEVRDEAAELLRDLLADGPVPVADAKKLLTEAGTSASTIQRAKKHLGVLSDRDRDPETGKTLGWTWQLPADDDQPEGNGEEP